MVEYFASFVFDREPHLSFSDGVIADRIPKGLYYMSTQDKVCLRASISYITWLSLNPLIFL